MEKIIVYDDILYFIWIVLLIAQLILVILTFLKNNKFLIKSGRYEFYSSCIIIVALFYEGLLNNEGYLETKKYGDIINLIIIYIPLFKSLISIKRKKDFFTEKFTKPSYLVILAMLFMVSIKTVILILLKK